MAPAKREVLLFAAKAVSLLALLLGPWPFVARGSALAFCVVGTSFLDGFVNDRDLNARFEPIEAEMAAQQGLDPGWTVVLVTTNWKTGEKSGNALELQGFYIPFAIFSALTIATPIDARRRRRILVGGLAVLAVRTLLGVAAPAERYLGLVTPGSAFDVVQRVAYRALIRPPDMVYAAPVLLLFLGLLLTRPTPGATRGAAAVLARRREPRAAAR